MVRKPGLFYRYLVLFGKWVNEFFSGTFVHGYHFSDVDVEERVYDRLVTAKRLATASSFGNSLTDFP